MQIETYKSNLLGSNMYMVLEGPYAIVIDPFCKPEIRKDVIPEMIILTHEHYDHISGVNEFKRKYMIPVICSQSCGDRISNSKHNMARYFEVFCELQSDLEPTCYGCIDHNYTCTADNTISNDYEIAWRGHNVKLMLLPGHSSGSIGILIDNLCFFSGDSVFKSFDTNCNFPSGSEAEWKTISLPKIKQIGPDTVVYPGHFDSFLLREWKEYKE